MQMGIKGFVVLNIVEKLVHVFIYIYIFSTVYVLLYC